MSCQHLLHTIFFLFVLHAGTWYGMLPRSHKEQEASVDDGGSPLGDCPWGAPGAQPSQSGSKANRARLAQVGQVVSGLLIYYQSDRKEAGLGGRGDTQDALVARPSNSKCETFHAAVRH